MKVDRIVKEIYERSDNHCYQHVRAAFTADRIDHFFREAVTCFNTGGR
jgi:hypothetical protein